MRNDRDSKDSEIAELQRQLETAHRKISMLEARVNEDELLGVLNRRGLEQEIDKAIQFGNRYGVIASLIYADLDDFKLVNDRFGHDIGDMALRHMVGVVQTNIRGSDLIGRIGGDEFVFLLWNATQEIAQNKASMLSAVLQRKPVIVGNTPLSLTFSCGVAELRKDDTPTTALARADQAMYFAKNTRKQADVEIARCG
ncbi:MAG: GGDEF domain-containing protein [Rhodobiaceae bacterium]|nr:GGDEF domain-containing protein [Rhodobiaceae bacterium]